ncbi:MAG: hypothetical protein K2O06_05550 [Acetatifactor sp.]|nr:hypothetical protein [Acetatifactor sp.]
MDPESYLSKSAEDRADPPGSLFSLLTAEPQSCALLQNVLNFFMEENIIYSPAHNAFLSQSQGKTTGYITEDIYPELCSLICQRCCIQSRQKEKQPDVKKQKGPGDITKAPKRQDKKGSTGKAGQKHGAGQHHICRCLQESFPQPSEHMGSYGFSALGLLCKTFQQQYLRYSIYGRGRLGQQG